MPARVDTSEAHALALDAADPLAAYRARFAIPAAPDGRPKVYLAGHSLGAQPFSARAAVEARLDEWARRGVEGHHDGDDGWLDADDALRDATARLVGARPREIATLEALTVDLHLLLASFFRPSGRQTAILIDAPTFPSDRYAVASHLRARGLDPASDLIVVRPRSGEATVRTDDLESAIHEHRDRLALAWLAGANYATGQVHDIARLTAAVHAAGAFAGWELAHAVGNVPLALHDDGVDIAAWCTYKYLNGGPGSPGQIFVHERHLDDPGVPRLAGWWGNDPSTRFEMAETFRPAGDATGWRVSNPPILSLAPVAASLAIFDEVGLAALRAKSIALTGYFEALVDELDPDAEILTPRDPDARGAQLSLRLIDATRRLEALGTAGVIGDFREPDIIRLAPVPLYNTFHDAWAAARALASTA